MRIELLDYENSEKKKARNYPAQYRYGLVRISHLVDDAQKEYQRIKSMEFEFNAPPMVARDNGPKITYFEGVDNIVIESLRKRNFAVNGQTVARLRYPHTERCRASFFGGSRMKAIGIIGSPRKNGGQFKQKKSKMEHFAFCLTMR